MIGDRVLVRTEAGTVRVHDPYEYDEYDDFADADVFLFDEDDSG